MGRIREVLRSPIAAISFAVAGGSFMTVGWVVAVFLGCEGHWVGGWGLGYEVSPPECIPVASVIQTGCCGFGVGVILALYLFFVARRESLQP